MLNKTHLISGGVAYASLVAACTLFFMFRDRAPVQTTTDATPPPQPSLSTNAMNYVSVPALPRQNVPPPKLYRPMYVKQPNVSSDAIRLSFTADEHVNLELGKNLFITPKVEHLSILYRDHWWERYVQLKGDFIPNEKYTLTIKKGTRSTHSYELLTDATLEVTIPEPTPSVSLLTYRGQMVLTPETALPCEYFACDEVRINVDKAFHNNLIHYGQSTWHDNLLEPYATHTYKVPLNKRQSQQALLPIYTLVKGQPGVYRFTLSTTTGKSSDECYIILSNIGATYVYDNRKLPIVAVQNLVDGSPLSNATVELYDTKHQLVATGRSDEQGIAVTEPTPLAMSRKQPSIPDRIIITAGDDLTIIECDDSTQHTAYQPDQTATPSFHSYLWPDRDGIHPGEQVQLYGLIRDAHLVAAHAIPLTLELLTPNDRILLSTSSVSNQDGYFTTSFAIPKDAKTGYYTVRAKFGNEVLTETDLYVSDFTPNHVRLQLSFPDEHYTSLTLTPSTYFGSPVGQGSGSYSITAAYATLPNVWKDWTIGNNETAKTLVASSFSKTDTSPTLTLAGVEEKDLLSFHAPLQLTGTATFSEPNSRAVTATTTLEIAPHNAYLALRYDEETKHIAFKQFVPNGREIVPGVIQNFALKKTIHDYRAVQKNECWYYEWMTYDEPIPLTSPDAPLDATPITIAGEMVTRELRNLEPGYYTLTATLNETTTTTLSFWHDSYYTGKTLTNPSNLVFQTDKTAYRPGETAQLTFNAPVDGRVVVVCGDTELKHAFTADVTAGPVTLPIPIPESALNGCWNVGVTLLAKDIKQEARYFGVATLKLDHHTRQLHVKLDLPEVVRPQETVPLKLNLTDHTGAPCRGTVALFAVDEAVLDVTGFDTPDPYNVLFQRPSFTFTFGDSYGSLLPQLRLLPDGHIGGDTRQRFRRSIDDSIDVSETTTVLSFPLQDVDASGSLTLPIQLPDFKGTLRFMAVVANEQCVGATDATVIVRPPATLTASSLRYGCPGDTAEFTFRVINHDLPSGPYTLTVGNTVLNGELATGEMRYHTLRLPVEATSATLQMGTFTTTVTQQVTLQNEVPTHIVTHIKRLALGETLPEGAEPLKYLKNLRDVALAWLANYPYYCTEQLSSRMLPYSSSTHAEEQILVKQLYDAYLASRLTPEGEFQLWGNNATICREASLFASQVLIEGAKLGYLPQEHLHTIVSALYLYACANRSDLRDRAAYAAFLLGEAGFPTQAVTAARNILITNTTDTAAFIAAATLVFNGFADEGAPIMKAYLAANPIPQPFFSRFMNNTALQGMVLSFAIRAGVCSEEYLNQRLNTLLSLPWKTTQANAWVARALSLCETLPNGDTFYRQDIPQKAIPQNSPTRVTKRICDREGNPITTLTHGDLAFVHITVKLPRYCSDLILRDRLPGGLEYEDANLATRESIQLPDWARQLQQLAIVNQENLGAELRFFGEAYTFVFHIVYPVRATTKGTFAIPAAIVEDMYDSTFTGGHDPAETLTIQ